MQTILRVKNVTKHYGGGSVVTKALDGISLDICEKEFYGFYDDEPDADTNAEESSMEGVFDWAML